MADLIVVADGLYLGAPSKALAQFAKRGPVRAYMALERGYQNVVWEVANNAIPEFLCKIVTVEEVGR